MHIPSSPSRLTPIYLSLTLNLSRLTLIPVVSLLLLLHSNS